MNAQVVSKTSKSVVIQIEVKFSDSMLQMEQHIQEVLNDAGNIATMEGLKRFDTTGGPIVLGNVKFTSKGQLPKEYQTPYGTVNIERHVYQAPDGGKTFCPLGLFSGLSYIYAALDRHSIMFSVNLCN